MKHFHLMMEGVYAAIFVCIGVAVGVLLCATGVVVL